MKAVANRCRTLHRHVGRLIGIIGVLVLCSFGTVDLVRAASLEPVTRPDRTQQIEDLIAALTPHERVAQLMLITFESAYLGEETAIHRLIADYGIGGVVLLAENDNINGQFNTPRLVRSLTNDLQQLAHDAAAMTTGPNSGQEAQRPYIPLFVATRHAGNGLAGSEIAVDTTPLPSYMAVGATWNPDYAYEVGYIAGSELSAMGVNMLLGPALDVLQRPQAENALNLGVNSFGGQPYWVGKMGAAYVQGAHAGSQNRLAVIAQNFPGLGYADTSPDQEIPVVPRSIDELRQFDLVPFHAVTGAATENTQQVDGFQCTNIRYQVSTTRLTTPPVCTDSRAAVPLLALDYFIEWRQTGIMISSPLGTPAIRRHYDSTPFPHRQIARDALLAGNDLLYLDDFGPQPGDSQLDNIIDVIDFFAERYQDDPVFRARVDQALARILHLKLALYDGDFSLGNVLYQVKDIDSIGGSSAPIFTAALESVTLLSPRRENLPPPPARDETIVIFTDVRLVQQCSYCPNDPLVRVNALEIAIEQMYGPYAGAQVRPEQVLSFSFSQLDDYLEGDIVGLAADSTQFKTIQRIGEALRDVDWIVLLMLDISPDIPSSAIVRTLLRHESSLVERANVITIALGAPTYLTATEISKFAAYYAVYSHVQPYINAAARALFQETEFSGAPPISLPAIGYDLFEATAPDPNQILQITADAINNSPPPPERDPAEAVTLSVGDRVSLRTLPILDRNGHRVPDGTPVEFSITFLTDNLQNRQQTSTVSGTARMTFAALRPGRVQITVTSDDARRSTTFQIVVEDEAVPVLPPDAQATQSAAANSDTDASSLPPANNPNPDIVPLNDTDNAREDSTGSAAPLPTSVIAASPTSERRLDALDFVVSLFGLALMSAAGFFYGRRITLTLDGGFRVALGCIVAGLIGYVYYGVGGPGANELDDMLANLAPLTVTLGTGTLGLVYTWWELRHE